MLSLSVHAFCSRRFCRPIELASLYTALLSSLWAADPAPAIRLNSIGYPPEAAKLATLAVPCTNFTLVRVADGAKVFAGVATGPALNADTEELLYTADFSAFRQTGEFRVESPGVGASAAFRIGADVYGQSFYVVARSMYLWRCGTAVSGEHVGQTFAHAACHTNDAWLDVVTGQHERQESLRGWHDAGDYNKYVVNAGITVGAMLRAWEDFGPAVRKVQLHLPESGGKWPDFLAELKWELDWLLTMQFQDGSVSHKVSTKRFGGFILPESEKEERFFTPWSSAATADFVAMLAQAARAFQPHDTVYAGRCLAAARKSYSFLMENPTNHQADLRGFSTGGYPTRDSDDRLWAAAELWETTGESAVLKELEERVGAAQARVDRDFDWGEVRNLGLFTYLNSKRAGRDEQLVGQVRKNLLGAADEIVTTHDAHGYGRPLGTRYYWGCNGSVARQTLVLMAAHRLAPKPQYRATALDGLNYLFGRNCYGRSFVTGLGYRPPLKPHDRRSGGDKIEAPWPGYLVGGPHPKATSWQDLQEDFRTNEIAINWNGALIYALAAFL